MLGTIIDKIQSLFSRNFLLGAFFPVLIFAAVNAMIAFFGLGSPASAIAVVNEFWNRIGPWQTIATGASLIGVGVLAYLLSTFLDVFRRLFEGEYLARWPAVWRIVMKPVRADLKARQKELNSARTRWAQRRRDGSLYEKQMDAAIESGNQPGVAGNLQRVEDAAAAVSALRETDPDEAANYANRLRDAVAALVTALQANRTLNPDPGDATERANRLDVLYRTLKSEEIARWIEETHRKFDAAWSDLYDRYVPEALYPTRLGNIRSVTESYSDKTYRVSFDYLWPRLQPVILKNAEMAPLVELAKSRLDFAVLMLTLSIATTAVWLVVLPFWGRSVWLFIAVGVVGPALIKFCYLLVEESQALFGALAKSAIDIFRLDVLPLMHQPLPDMLSAERQRWSDLQKLPDAAGTIDIRFQHQKPA